MENLNGHISLYTREPPCCGWSIKMELGGKAIGETTHYSALRGDMDGMLLPHRDAAISETKRS